MQMTFFGIDEKKKDYKIKANAEDYKIKVISPKEGYEKKKLAKLLANIVYDKMKKQWKNQNFSQSI